MGGRKPTPPGARGASGSRDTEIWSRDTGTGSCDPEIRFRDIEIWSRDSEIRSRDSGIGSREAAPIIFVVDWRVSRDLVGGLTKPESTLSIGAGICRESGFPGCENRSKVSRHPDPLSPETRACLAIAPAGIAKVRVGMALTVGRQD